MVGPTYKENERLIFAKEEEEEESTGIASWPLSDSSLSTLCKPDSHGWMTTVIKND